jgi:outer membrane biosynthesis protein TonB
MSASRSQPSMLRPDRPEISRLVWALAASLLLHAACYGVYEAGKKAHLWDRIHLPAWVQALVKATLPQVKDAAKQPPAQREPPLMFVQVNPDTAVAEPPKNAKYYAAQSTRAANPDADHETDVPKISGSQEHVMHTEDTQRSKAQPLQPAPAPPAPAPEPAPPPKPAVQPGDLTLAKAQPETARADETPRPRPRTVAEAKARLAQLQHASPTTNQKARQDGGVRQHNVVSSLDAIGSPFGAYDATIVAAIQNRWYDLLDERRYASDQSGRVVVEFRLNYDGRISDLKVVDSSVDEILSLLCQKAILDPSPYAKWPSDMRRKVDADYREVRFTFYYN